MTTQTRPRAPFTHALYGGSPFLDGWVVKDLHGFLVAEAPFLQWGLAPADMLPALADVYRSLWKAVEFHLARPAAQWADDWPRFRDRITEIRQEAERIGPESGPDTRATVQDIVARLLLYGLELADRRILLPIQVHSGRYASEAQVGSDTTLLALALVSADGEEPWWDVQGHVREGAIRYARAALLGPQRVEDEPLPVDDLDDDRVGIVRTSPTLMVCADNRHLPGTAKPGQDRSTLGYSGPRAELAPIAGVELPLVHDPDLRWLWATLLDEVPWARAAIEALLSPLAGQPFVRIPPTLLVGSPGCGKTALARRVGAMLGLSTTVYSCAGVMDAAYGGTSRQWSNGRFSVSLQAIIRGRHANPLIVLDEAEKGGSGDTNGRLADALVPFLEQESARAYFDPYAECPVNLSAVSYIATANSVTGIPGPLLDRFRIVEIPEPGPEHLGVIVKRIVDDLRESAGYDDAWIPDLDGTELSALSEHWQGGSIRKLRRLVEAVVQARDVLSARH